MIRVLDNKEQPCFLLNETPKKFSPSRFFPNHLIVMKNHFEFVKKEFPDASHHID